MIEPSRRLAQYEVLQMSFRLVENGWQGEIDEALSIEKQQVCIVCPFIKYRVAERILKYAHAPSMRVLTRFNLQDFADGVSDVSAIQLMLAHGTQVRGIRNLHAKLYLFGKQRAIITSANLTGCGLRSNAEFGCVSDEPAVVSGCGEYFDGRWPNAASATVEELASWQSVVTSHHAASGEPALRPPLPDYGSKVAEVVSAPHIFTTQHPRIADSEAGFCEVLRNE